MYCKTGTLEHISPYRHKTYPLPKIYWHTDPRLVATGVFCCLLADNHISQVLIPNTICVCREEQGVTSPNLPPQTSYRTISFSLFNISSHLSSSSSPLPLSYNNQPVADSVSSFFWCASSSTFPGYFCDCCVVFLAFLQRYHFDKVVSFWLRRHPLTFHSFFCLLSLSLSGDNGCVVYKWQWGGGIPQSIIRMNAHTHSHSQMHTEIHPRVETFWCLKAQTKTHTHSPKKRTLHRNIIQICILLSSCITGFLHNGGNSGWCVYWVRMQQTKCEMHVRYILSGRHTLCVRGRRLSAWKL